MAVIGVPRQAAPRHALAVPSPLARLADWCDRPHPKLREFGIEWMHRAGLAALPVTLVVVGLLMPGGGA